MLLLKRPLRYLLLILVELDLCLALVHQGLLDGENVADSVRRAEALGNKIKLQVPGGDRIKVHGLGSLAPSDRYSANRIELILP